MQLIVLHPGRKRPGLCPWKYRDRQNVPREDLRELGQESFKGADLGADQAWRPLDRDAGARGLRRALHEQGQNLQGGT